MDLISDIFLQKKQRWDSLLQMRKLAQEDTRTCPKCKQIIPTEQLTREMNVCPHCGFYMPLSASERIEALCDADSFKELFNDMTTANPLNFPGYEEKLAEVREKTGLQDAFVAGVGQIHHIKAAIGVLDGRFLMGSMGTAVGEKITLLAEYAAKKHLPLIIFSASGGARMQEGLFSLMQMAKTASAVERFKQKGGLFLSVLTNPTTGGVSASYASLGDIILAEPDALICFAGPRVIEQTIGQKLPEGFQHAEFLQDHGMIDRIVTRKKMRATIGHLLKMHGYE